MRHNALVQVGASLTLLPPPDNRDHFTGEHHEGTQYILVVHGNRLALACL